jgi:ElaB/YqjD/DUF883 family membrane-anchored ribosome-binding protein
MTHHTDPKQIEAALMQERAQLSSTLGALRNRLSAAALTDDAMAMVQSKASASTRMLDTAVRSNPWAVAAVGAGLAWLFFAKPKQAEVPAMKREAMANWEDDGGPARPSDAATPDGQRGYAQSVRASSASGRMIEDHPIWAGMVLLGVGAALGTILPRTRIEDEAFAGTKSGMAGTIAAHLTRGMGDA